MEWRVVLRGRSAFSTFIIPTLSLGSTIPRFHNQNSHTCTHTATRHEPSNCPMTDNNRQVAGKTQGEICLGRLFALLCCTNYRVGALKCGMRIAGRRELEAIPGPSLVCQWPDK